MRINLAYREAVAYFIAYREAVAYFLAYREAVAYFSPGFDAQRRTLGQRTK